MEIEAMNHSEAIQQMATERYLLDELSPNLRDAFEEHMFDCPKCALDVRTAAAFVQEAKIQLPELTSQIAGSPVPSSSRSKGDAAKEKKPWWFRMWQPVFANPTFAAPVFATLLAIVGYQNLVTVPALRSEVNQPRLASTVFLHSGSRGSAHVPVKVDRKQGAALLIDTPPRNGYASFFFELRDPQGKLAWSIADPIAAPQNNGQESGAVDGTLSLAITGDALHDGAYTLVVSGVTPGGERTEIERHMLDFHVTN
jgi:Putative zinc-finger